MDPDFAEKNHPGAYTNSGNTHPSPPVRSFGVSYEHIPEDVEGALRYTPLTSVVPVSGGKSYRVKGADICTSIECIAGTTIDLLLSNSIDCES